MKVYKFHQFIRVERGIVKSLIIDFLKKDIYHVDNKIIKDFENREYAKIKDFMDSALEEDLLIKVDENRWIPYINFNKDKKMNISIELEVDKRVNLEFIKNKLGPIKIAVIRYYGEDDIEKYFFADKIKKEKINFKKCSIKSGKHLMEIDKNLYEFNMNYNPCWGKRIAITKDNKVRPCIYSEIVVGDLLSEEFSLILKRMEKYWKLTKDKIEICKDCEFRYICFDCRELALRKSNNLYEKNPKCFYNPYTGESVK